MRLAWYTTTFLCAFFSPVCFGAQTVTKLNTVNGNFLIVPVSITGSGPYSFILDTGSNRTLIRNTLLETLRISSTRVVPLNMTNGVIYTREAVAKSVAVAGLSVNDLEVEGIDDDQLARISAFVQGVLGEDFLKHFDVLIDNHVKTLTLDDSADLAHSLSGEHLPLSFSGRRGDQSTVDRLVLNVKLFSIEKLHFQLDSGTNSATFFPSKAVPYIGPGAFRETITTPKGNSQCRIDFVTLKIGKSTFHNQRLASYEGVTRDNLDMDGTLPISMFDRLFISHAEAYAIVNPRIQKPSGSTLSVALSRPFR
ncbi:retropepsin-like aspartic protease [Alloacidobacterium sp.]|uniref:retropepsin-like aspartic protease n=1 Tax=Alloacidobacterium sp. TaxID=2951999 RepID=UPI002D59788D|nr:retropepsin-like aspartic protease [Alloacidobacterium sp.]HYK34453.1 retropepsin-like aspartic protease [Alloacidobacterium sp.]